MSALLEVLLWLVAVWAVVSVLMLSLAFVGGYAANLHDRIRTGPARRAMREISGVDTRNQSLTIENRALRAVNADLQQIAFGITTAEVVLAADSDPTPPHGTVRPIRGGAE